MNCDDCPNQTDGTCCHQLIRPQGSKTMNVLDIQAWERELNHAAKMQAQRKPKQVGTIGVVDHTKVSAIYSTSFAYAYKDSSNEK